MILILLDILSPDLVPDFPFVTPDDEEVYELVEDSLRKKEEREFPDVREYRLLLRVKSDTIKSGKIIRSTPVFLRFCGSGAGREMVLLLEKDKEERNLADFIGGGISVATGTWRFAFGDFLTGFGRGLILALPYGRSGFNTQSLSETKSTVPRSAQENRNLRGLKVDLFLSNWEMVLFGSYSLRDAILNPDGSVARMSFSGVHRDSATEASRNQLGQLLSGGYLRYINNPIFQFGICVYTAVFNRPFSPEDSAVSFWGQKLGVGSIYFCTNYENKQLELELGRSIPGGSAATTRVSVREGGVNTQVNATVYQQQFFSPAGRRYNINQCRSRLELNGKMDYKKGGLKLGISGNTYRDYLTDSIPARLTGNIGYEFTGFEVGVRLGRLYRMEIERSRFTDVEMKITHRDFWGRVFLKDQYNEYFSGKGILVALSIKRKLARGELSINFARFLISGGAIIMTAPESGFLRIGSSYSSRTSAWRLSLTGGYRWSKLGRLGVKVGMVYNGSLLFDGGMQLEVGVRVD